MIAQLVGTVAEIDGNTIVVDVGNVGYEVIVSNQLISNMTESVELKVYIYEHIREQEHSLYGFSTKDDKRLFEHLLSVNGVGPKAALALFDLAEADILRNEIANGNTLFLTQASGVGKKAAERVIVDLQDKVGPALATSRTHSLVSGSDEALEGLLALGYSKDQALQMLVNVDATTAEERIKQALKNGR